jgi:steroid 5-alpha reductase family enzyme
MSRDFQAIVAAYAAAAAMAVAVACAVPFEHPIAVVLAADVAATGVVFAFSFAFRNSSFYDAYWSVAPPVIAGYWVAGAAVVGGARQLVVLGLVCAWAVRLTYNWARWWEGLDHQDWRYRDLQKTTGRAYWLVSLAGIHLLPTLWVFGGCLALYPALALGTAAFGALDWLATAVTGGAIVLEAVADQQLASYRRSGPPAGQTLTTGLRRYARHPNYLGEMGFWWGIFLFGLAAAPSWWWTAIGPLAITGMFYFISLPLIEIHMLEARPDYKAYAERTNLVIPGPPRAETP